VLHDYTFIKFFNCGYASLKYLHETNTNALNLVTPDVFSPHPIPLPSGERDRVRGSHVKKLNAFALHDKLPFEKP